MAARQRAKALAKIEDIIKQLEDLSDQTAVHRKKFEYAMVQVRRLRDFYGVFRFSFEQVPGPVEAGMEATIFQQLDELDKLFRDYGLRTWAVHTIGEASCTVVENLHRIFSEIRTCIKALSPTTGDVVETDPLELQTLDFVDLRAISASFRQYLKRSDIDDEVRQSMRQRLASIDGHLESCQGQASTGEVNSAIPVNYQQWKVSLSDFASDGLIGVGSSAAVILATDRRDNSRVAIKKFTFKKLNSAKFQLFQREVAVLATLQHPTLIRLVGATDTPPFCIITEWMPNESLHDDLHKRRKLDPTMKTIAAFDIARGMQFLHANNIVHRDLKPLNVLLDKDYHAKLCDFGLSRYANEDSLMTRNIGTPHWMAPELLKKGNYTNKVDVYAYAIVLWEIATGKTPYEKMSAKEIVYGVGSNDVRPRIPRIVGSGMEDLITRCWDKDPAVRPTFSEIVRMFESGTIGFHDADMREVRRYIRENTTSDQQCVIEFEDIADRAIRDIAPLDDVIAALERCSLPTEMSEKMWTVVKHLLDRYTDVADTRKISVLFPLCVTAKTRAEAATIFRSLPRHSIPVDIITEFISDLPTASPEADTSMAIAACRNDAADLCAVYVTNPIDVAVALDSCSQLGVDPQLKQAVGDRCVQVINSGDPNVVMAALRCILALEHTAKLSVDSVAKLLTCSNKTVRLLAYACLCELVMSGRPIPQNTTTKLLDDWPTDSHAASVVVASCRVEDRARNVLEWLTTHPSCVPPETVIRAVLHASRHRVLWPAIGELISREEFRGDEFEGHEAMQFLRNRVFP